MYVYLLMWTFPSTVVKFTSAQSRATWSPCITDVIYCLSTKRKLHSKTMTVLRRKDASHRTRSNVSFCGDAKADNVIVKFNSLVLETKCPPNFPRGRNGDGNEASWSQSTWLNEGTNTDLIPSAAFWHRHKHNMMLLSHLSSFLWVLFGFNSEDKQTHKLMPQFWA